jgi:hypothetical protein
VRKVITFIFVLNSFFLHAGETCPDETRKELKREVFLEESVINTFHVIWTISQYRKGAFDDGALNLINDMDDGIYLRADLALDIIDIHPSPDYQKLLDAFDRLFNDTSYYELTWSEEEMSLIKRKLNLVKQKSKHNNAKQ